MVKFFKQFLDWGTERSIKGCEVGQIDGIELFDARNRGGCFKITIESSLHLIRQYDPRRYARVKRYISRIVNVITSDGYTGQYNLSTRSIHLEFREMSKLTDEERAAIYACVLIDNATCGILRRARKRKPSIDHSRVETQIRTAKLYVAEHNRFLEKLVEADLLPFPTFKLFRMEFDEKHPPKTSGKKKNPLKMLFSVAWKAATEQKIKKK
jgi:hypothetical protein